MASRYSLASVASEVDDIEANRKTRKTRSSITSIDASDDVDLLDEIHMIFARESRHRPAADDPSGKTVSVEDKEKENLSTADHLFVNPFNLDTFTAIPTNEHSRTVASYVIDRQDGVRILFVNQTDVLFYDGGRLPIMYEIYNKHNQLLMIVDGRESACGGMEVYIKGNQDGMILGKVKATGFCRFQASDFYNDKLYFISIPWWVAFFTCFLCCCFPCFRITRSASNPTHHRTNDQQKIEEEIAVLGFKKWEDTFFKSEAMFCLHFLNKGLELEADYKLFLFAASLAFYHCYFKRAGKAIRCFLCYFLVIVLLVLLGFLFYFLVIRWN